MFLLLSIVLYLIGLVVLLKSNHGRIGICVITASCLLCLIIGYNTMLTAIAVTKPTYGSYGYFEIQSCGVEVPLYDAPINAEGDVVEAANRAQRIVDAANSACIMDWTDDTLVIADHTNQGFNKIKKCSVGDTARIYLPDGSIREYTCVLVDPNGYNDSTYIQWSDRSWAITGNPSGLNVYTCNDSYKSITICKFTYTQTISEETSTQTTTAEEKPVPTPDVQSEEILITKREPEVKIPKLPDAISMEKYSTIHKGKLSFVQSHYSLQHK